MLYQEQENNRISNLYNIQFVNKTFEDITLEVQLQDFESGEINRVGGEILSGEKSMAISIVSPFEVLIAYHL